MPPPMIEERTLLDFDIVQDFIYQKNGIKKPLESVRGSLVRHCWKTLQPAQTPTVCMKKKYSFIRCLGWMFLYVRLPGERPHSAEQRYDLIFYSTIYFSSFSVSATNTISDVYRLSIHKFPCSANAICCCIYGIVIFSVIPFIIVPKV